MLFFLKSLSGQYLAMSFAAIILPSHLGIKNLLNIETSPPFRILIFNLGHKEIMDFSYHAKNRVAIAQRGEKYSPFWASKQPTTTYCINWSKVDTS